MAIDQTQMQEYAKQWGQLVARSWSDDAFKQRLLAEPGPALAEQGIELPPGIEVRVHENSPRLVHLTLPPAPAEELSDEQLDAVAGGDSTSTAGSVGTLSSYSLTVATASSLGTGGTAAT
jgi:hypothetical protein